jgi:hypothetical protein
MVLTTGEAGRQGGKFWSAEKRGGDESLSSMGELFGMWTRWVYNGNEYVGSMTSPRCHS